MRLLRVPLGGITGLAYGPDGTLVTGDTSGKVLHWPASGRPRQLLGPQEGEGPQNRRPGWVLGSADGRVVAVQRRNHVLLFDLSTDDPPRRLTASGLNGHSAALSPDGRGLAAFGYTLLGGRRLSWLDTATGQERVVTRRLGTIRRVAISADNQLIGVYAAGLFEKGISVVRANDGERLLHDFRRTVPRFMQFIPGTGQLAWANGSTLYDVNVAESRIRAIAAHGRALERVMIRAAAFSPDGRLTATSGLGPFVHLWDVASSSLLCSFDTQFTRVVNLAFAPDGLTLAAGSSNRAVAIYDLDL